MTISHLVSSGQGVAFTRAPVVVKKNTFAFVRFHQAAEAEETRLTSTHSMLHSSSLQSTHNLAFHNVHSSSGGLVCHERSADDLHEWDESECSNGEPDCGEADVLCIPYYTSHITLRHPCEHQTHPYMHFLASPDRRPTLQ